MSRRFCPVADLQLRQETAHIVADGLLAEAQRLGDLLVRLPLRNQTQDISLGQDDVEVIALGPPLGRNGICQAGSTTNLRPPDVCLGRSSRN